MSGKKPVEIWRRKGDDIFHGGCFESDTSLWPDGLVETCELNGYSGQESERDARRRENARGLECAVVSKL